MKIEVKKECSVYVARAIDDEGHEVASVAAFSKRKAKALIEHKLFNCKKPKMKKVKKDINKPQGKSGSVMSGLIGVTSSRNWKHAK